MFLYILAGLATVSATVVLHAGGTTWWLQRLKNRASKPEPGTSRRAVLSVLVQTALVLIFLHTAEVFFWALTLRFLPQSSLSSLEEAMYFSFTTFTTLGYGDIVLKGPGRLLTGVESLNGVLLIGWSTALSFAVIQRIWEGQAR